MCGRFVSTSTPDAIADYFGATATVAPLDVNFNVAPTHAVYGVVARATDPDTPLDKTVRAFRWGLIPSWANDHRIGARMINARAETLKQKPSFRDLVKNRRVIIPMDGFYEWKLGVANGPGNAGGVPLKQPMYIHSVDGSPLAVAGLRATWKDPSDPNHRWLHSTTLITTAANDLMSLVHDRMPVLIPRDRWDDWLNPNYDNIDALSDIFTATNDSILKMHAVSAKVNDVRNNAPDLLAEI
ncbi:SOS response-associated peptidase [uncultured Ilumatobacter sp.]|uniref:SOS response-associated peptidase n=1 Tax=uncultured Ilumatobacter sp. TaxID=879968 RepID=UPI00374FA423